jgi:hypothetical protein
LIKDKVGKFKKERKKILGEQSEKV